MTDQAQKDLNSTLWSIADTLRGSMNADDFRDYILSFLFLRHLSENYETAAKKELGSDYPKLAIDEAEGAAKTPLGVWYKANQGDVATFEAQMRKKVHYVIKPDYLWNHIVHLAQTQDDE